MRGVATPPSALPGEPRVRRPLVPDSVAGTIMFVFTEVMFFAGFISAHMVFVSNQVGEVWPPADQPLLPFAETLRNSALLMASGVTLAPVLGAMRRGDRKMASLLLGLSGILGALFVSTQGVEWVGLLSQGLTINSSAYGAFFYMIVGAHALHAVGGVACLAWGWSRLHAGSLHPHQLVSIQIFWYFVVAVWPVIFLQVYR
jgi:cytochrome c oxidase subunit III